MNNIFKKILEHPYLVPFAAIATIFGTVFAIYTYYSSQTTQIDTTISTNTKKISTVTEKIFQGSIFELTNKIFSEPITVKKQKLVTENAGLIVQDFGYVMDITKGTFTDKEMYAMNLAGKNRDKKTMVQCLFDKKWEQTISNGDFSQGINFKGEIVGEKNYNSPFFIEKQEVPLIYLGDCTITK